MHILEARTRVLASRIRARVGHGHDTLRTLLFFLSTSGHILDMPTYLSNIFIIFLLLRHVVNTLEHVGDNISL